MRYVPMPERTIFDGSSPKTQSIEAVKALLTWKGRAVDPLPSVVAFANEGEESRLMLVLSNQKDNYYVVTPTACSCPARTDRPGEPCKHIRKYFGAKPEIGATEEPTEGARHRVARPPKSSPWPVGGWVGPDGPRANGPVEA